MIEPSELDELLRQAGEIRSRLEAERADLLARVSKIDVTLALLGVRAKRLQIAPKSLQPEDVGRTGIQVNGQDVLHAVARYYGFPVASLTGQERHASVALARHVAMYMVRKLTNASFPEIGRLFGMRDHTTCISGNARIAALVENLETEDAELRAEVQMLERTIEEARQARVTPNPLTLVEGG